MAVAGSDLFMRYETNIMCTPGTMSGLECNPAACNLNLFAAFTGTYLLPVVLRARQVETVHKPLPCFTPL